MAVYTWLLVSSVAVTFQLGPGAFADVTLS